MVWLLVSILRLPASDQTETGGRILFQSWGTEDGLPQNHATAIAQTRDGYLWLGTYNGIARFDGLRFTVFDSVNSPGLRSSRIISLHHDAEGTLWLGHEAGELSRYVAGRFEPVPLPSQWPREPIDGIAEDARRDLWLLSRAGHALRLRDGFLVPAKRELTSAPVPQLVRDNSDHLWRLQEGKLAALSSDRTTPNLPASADEFVAFAAAARTNGLWIATSEQLRHWTSDGTTRIWGKPPWGGSSVTALLETRTGHLWAGTLDRGLFVIAPDGTHSHFTHTNGFPHAWIRCLFEDREGTIWAGTGGGGLSAARERRVTMFNAPDGWQKRTLISVSAGASNTLWIGTEGGGVYRWTAGRFDHFESPSGLGNLFVWSVLEDAHGAAWAGTWGGGMFRQQGNQFLPAPAPLNDPLRTLALYNARDTSLWVGTQRGLVRIKDGRTEPLAVELDQPDVRCITEASDGTIWFGMAGGGLGRWRDGRATQFRKADGLPSDYVWSLLADSNGDLWIGTFGGGLSRLRGDRFSTVGAGEGLPNNVICHLADDGKGLVWMSTYGGILRASKAALNRCADGLEPTVPIFTYGKSDGLAVLECTGGSQPSGCRTADGKLWFPTSRGLAMVDPSNLTTNHLAPPVVIEHVSVDLESAEPYRVAATNALYRIPPGKQRFEFRYTGLSFIASHRIHFKYRLEPLDDDWVDAGTARTANYSFLEPGDYTFRVIARNNDGVWNETGASVALTVLPYFWQTISFKFAIALGGALVIGGTARTVTRRRYRRKLEQLERQRAVERERARIAKDIHDDLGASLTRITLLSQSARNPGGDATKALQDLDNIYLTARELTKAMDEIVWAVNPHHDTLDSLVTYLGRFAQDFAGAAGIRCRLDVPIQLPAWPLTAEIRHNLFLAVKEALNNALKHSRASEINLTLQLGERSFALSVIDNGVGFNAAALESAGHSPTADSGRIASGNGLNNMRKRLDEIGGRCFIVAKPGAGTRVTLSVNVS
jgi:signal transduction histidine kinase/ligand-binding sensor domain-containing protein